MRLRSVMPLIASGEKMCGKFDISLLESGLRRWRVKRRSSAPLGVYRGHVWRAYYRCYSRYANESATRPMNCVSLCQGHSSSLLPSRGDHVETIAWEQISDLGALVTTELEVERRQVGIELGAARYAKEYRRHCWM